MVITCRMIHSTEDRYKTRASHYLFTAASPIRLLSPLKEYAP